MRYGQAVLDPVRDVKRQRILREIKTLAKPNPPGDQPLVSRCATYAARAFSTNTVTVLSILSLTTRPVSVRVVSASLISLPPFPSGWCALARCHVARFLAGCCW